MRLSFAFACMQSHVWEDVISTNLCTFCRYFYDEFLTTNLLSVSKTMKKIMNNQIDFSD
jgi:uncharacterized membrane protein YwaF